VGTRSRALDDDPLLKERTMAQTGYANPAALVSTEWAADHLSDPKVRFIEVDVDTEAYGKGHVAGAVGVNWSTELTDQIRRDIPPKASWEALLSRAGVGADTKIVFYGDNNNWFAAYAYWVAKMYGHGDVALMNGGRKKWEGEGRPLVTDAPNVAANVVPLELRFTHHWPGAGRKIDTSVLSSPS
jgi:thiosulfate/3-mercaptopyruvate sulfurtransferase